MNRRDKKEWITHRDQTKPQNIRNYVVWLLNHVWLFVTPWTVARQSPLSMGFPRQECWSWLPFPTPRDFRNQVTEPLSLASPALVGRFFTTSTTWEVQKWFQFNSVQFSCSAVSNSLWPHGLQHTRPPCPSPTPGVYPNSCPLSQWCHPTISSSVIPFSSCLQSLQVSGSFQMSEFFASGGPSIGVSASASVLPMKVQDWFPLGWTGWISLKSKGLSRVFCNTTVQKH